MSALFSTFGQELYQEVSIKSIEQFHSVRDHNELLQSIVSILPQNSPKTRIRIAEKIIQRYFTPPNNGNDYRPFLDMVRLSSSEQNKLALVYWRTARTDKIISAIVSEIFYPYFINAAIPGGYTEQQFDTMNTFTLFNIDRIITAGFVQEYAASKWSFTSKKSITLALRVMRQAGLIDSVPIASGAKRTLGFYPTQRFADPDVLAFCLYEEFRDEKLPPMVLLNQVQESDSVKLFFLSRMQLDSILTSLSGRKLIGMVNQHGRRFIEFLHPNTGGLVSALYNSKDK